MILRLSAGDPWHTREDRQSGPKIPLPSLPARVTGDEDAKGAEIV
jgi:hypothetical protein